MLAAIGREKPELPLLSAQLDFERLEADLRRVVSRPEKQKRNSNKRI